MPRSAQAKGSANAARTAGSVGPSGTTFFATSRGGRAMNSPYAPLTNSRSSQRFERPARQGRHAPHGAELAATTRSPSRTPRTPAPIAVTVPANSWPNTVGTFGIMTGWPRRSGLTSVPQVGAASIRSTGSPLSGRGTGNSSARRSPGPWNTIALMLRDPNTGALHGRNLENHGG